MASQGLQNGQVDLYETAVNNNLSDLCYEDEVNDQPSALNYYQGRELTLFGQNPPFDGQTNYNDEYRAWDLPKRAQPPQPIVKPNIPFDADTTYNKEYSPKPLEKKDAPLQLPYQPNPVKFEGVSNYQAEFNEKPLEKRQAPALPQGKPQIKFDATTSYQNTYKPYKIEPQQVTQVMQYEMPKVPFDSKSVYSQDFPAHQIQPHAKPPQMPPKMQLPFEGTTTNRTDYVAYPIEPKQAPPAMNYQSNPVKFEGQSESAAQYKAHELQKREAPRLPPPKQQLPFDAHTSYQDQFKGWKLPKQIQSIGICMEKDQYCIFISKDAPRPHSCTKIFTTMNNFQEHMCILLFYGDNPRASQNSLIGQFTLQGVPKAQKKTPQIEVTLKVDENNVLSAFAQDLGTNNQASWYQGSRINTQRLDNIVEPIPQPQAIAT